MLPAWQPETAAHSVLPTRPEGRGKRLASPRHAASLPHSAAAPGPAEVVRDVMAGSKRLPTEPKRRTTRVVRKTILAVSAVASSPSPPPVPAGGLKRPASAASEGEASRERPRRSSSAASLSRRRAGRRLSPPSHLPAAAPPARPSMPVVPPLRLPTQRPAVMTWAPPTAEELKRRKAAAAAAALITPDGSSEELFADSYMKKAGISMRSSLRGGSGVRGKGSGVAGDKETLREQAESLLQQHCDLFGGVLRVPSTAMLLQPPASLFAGIIRRPSAAAPPHTPHTPRTPRSPRSARAAAGKPSGVHAAVASMLRMPLAELPFAHGHRRLKQRVMLTTARRTDDCGGEAAASFRLAMLHYNACELKAAAAALRRCCRLWEAAFQQGLLQLAHNALCVIYHQLGAHDRALHHATQHLLLCDADEACAASRCVALLNRGLQHSRLGESAAAAADWRKAVRIAPLDDGYLLPLQLELGEVTARDAKAALPALAAEAELLQADSAGDARHRQLGELAARLGDYSAAEASLKTARSLARGRGRWRLVASDAARLGILRGQVRLQQLLRGAASPSALRDGSLWRAAKQSASEADGGGEAEEE
eukprot:PLAT8791.1.p1 GENE.PLAT8791.1~~PLAT8791.1.p1  ORF type:complete len:595 (-),score=251.43 PLAT8791.1:55-1839(-)